jgi:hypothetical protein
MRGSNKQWDYKLGKPMGVTYIFVYNFQRYLYLVHVITLYYNVVQAQHNILFLQVRNGECLVSDERKCKLERRIVSHC